MGYKTHEQCRPRREDRRGQWPDQRRRPQGRRRRFRRIADATAKGDEIAINGFGKFKVKATPERDGRNPFTSATIKIAASKKLTFAPVKAVKDRLNG